MCSPLDAPPMRALLPLFFSALLSSSAALAQEPAAPPEGPLFVRAAEAPNATVVLGPAGERCAMPCRLPLPRGLHRVTAEGLFSQRISVRSASDVFELQGRRGSPGGELLIFFGVLPLGLAAAALSGTGLGLLAVAGATGTVSVAGLVSLLSGGALSFLSFPLVLAGALRVGRARPHFQLRAGPSSAALELRF